MTFKWAQLANLILPIVSLTIPAAEPLVPYIQNGIFQAQQLHGDTDNVAKKQLVLDGVGAAVATGKVKIDPATASQITEAVFSAIDGFNAIVQANKPTPVPVVP